MRVRVRFLGSCLLPPSNSYRCCCRILLAGCVCISLFLLAFLELFCFGGTKSCFFGRLFEILTMSVEVVGLVVCLCICLKAEMRKSSSLEAMERVREESSLSLVSTLSLAVTQTPSLLLPRGQSLYPNKIEKRSQKSCLLFG